MQSFDLSEINCLGYNIFTDRLSRILVKDKLLINTINQYSYCIAEKDQDFKKALLESDVLLPDGVGIVWAARFLKGEKIKKVAGADIHDFFLKELNKNNGSCFYMGSSEKTLQKIKVRLTNEYPNIRLETYSPPFKKSFSDEDNKEILRRVNNFKPDVLFVGMTAPKQEKWSYNHFEKLNATYICSIGAVFDFYAGTVKRPGIVWQNMGLEWMGRLLKEPKRMYKRYINNGVLFAYYLFREKTRMKIAK